MTKKWLAVVGLAAVIAVSGGVIAITGNQSHSGGTEPSVPAISYTDDQQDDTDDNVDTDDVTEVSDETEADDPVTATEKDDKKEDNDPVVSDVNGYSDDLITTTSFSIARIIDHTDGSECTPREVFGKLYYYCYLSFKSNGEFELCINPSSGDILTGEYCLYDDVISIEYADGTGSEYTIISDNEGGVDYIIVNYGDYDVYFV